MEISLDHSNKANVEAAKQVKRLANNLLEVDTAAEEESRARADIEDQAGIAERKGLISNFPPFWPLNSPTVFRQCFDLRGRRSEDALGDCRSCQEAF